MQQCTSILDLTDAYDGFILDLWGVIHDGHKLYPGAKETLMELKERGKQVVLLSNAPRRSHRSAETLASLGLNEGFYHHIITSGEVVYSHLFDARGTYRTYYYMGPDKDMDILDGLPLKRGGLAQADIILNVGFFFDHQPLDELRTTLKTAVALKKTMICANPDIIVVRQNGERLECAGLIAKEYERYGGKVQYVGKPYPDVFERALGRFEDVRKDRVLVVGDGLETDVLGANRFGLKCAFVAGGILRDALRGKSGEINRHAADEAALQAGAKPDYIIPSMSGK